MTLESEVIGKFQELGYYQEQSDTYVNVFGIRGRESRVNYFDDYIGIFRRVKGFIEFKVWKGTTRPGLPSLLKPVNRRGTAILVPGQYKDAYRCGYYKGYLALKQTGEVRVYRDATLDEKWDTREASIDEGLFGIHIHRAGLWSKVVGPYSAGCQVIHRVSDYNECMKYVMEAENVGQFKFTYTLLEF